MEYPCKPEFIRPIAGTTANKKVVGVQVTKHEINETNSSPQVAGDFLDCPIQQKTVKNGAQPNAELFKKIIRCKKGEKAVDEGDEGAVGVEVSSIQIGASRPWRYSQDSGNAKPGAIVYPVKATFTIRTFYRNATEVEENWIRILNFYVNAFGEWQVGSEESVKAGKFKRIPTE